jgi:preprotein translocase subunit SecY
MGLGNGASVIITRGTTINIPTGIEDIILGVDGTGVRDIDTRTVPIIEKTTK